MTHRRIRLPISAPLVLAALLLPVRYARADEGAGVAPEKLTIDDAVRIALANHPTVTADRAQVAVAGARTREAWAEFTPSLTASAVYSPQTANSGFNPSFARAIGQSNNISYDLGNYYDFQVGLNWRLFDFGQTWYGWRAAQQNQIAAEKNLGAGQLQVVFDARSAFDGVLAADALVHVQEESVNTQEHHVEQMKAFVQVGTRTAVDLAQTESTLASARLSLAKARGQRENALATLHSALGLEKWTSFQLVAPPEGSDDAAAAEQLKLPDDPLSAAVAARPEVRQSDALVNAAVAQRKAQRGAWFPQLSLSFGPSFSGEDVTNLAPNFSLTLALSYSGGLNFFGLAAARREALANVDLAREQARGVRNGIRLEVAQALADLRSAREAVVAAKALVDAATEQRKLANGRFEAGLGTTLDLQDAELNYVTAKQQDIQAHFDLAVVRARVEKALGR